MFIMMFNLPNYLLRLRRTVGPNEPKVHFGRIEIFERQSTVESNTDLGT